MKNLWKIILLVCVFLLTSLPVFASEAKDTISPSDVENLKAEAKDSEVSLSWDLPTDNVGVVGYNIYYGMDSVTSDSNANYTEVVKVGDVIEYTIKGLSNDTTYYFAATALDKAGNESGYYSNEVSATPQADAADDEEAPKVISAEALNNTKIEVVFSEPVVLPSDYPEEAFMVQNNDTLETLDVSGASFGSDKSTVILNTAPQEDGVSYIVTAGIDVEDKAGNPVIGGVSDAAVFSGSGEVEPAAEPVEEPDISDKEPPFIAGVESLSDTEVKITFNEKINLSVDPTENFEIVLESDPEDKLKITEISLKDEDFTVSLTTEKQSKVTYLLTVAGVSDKNGNEIVTEEDKNKVTFTGKGETTLLDLVAPENITNVFANVLNGAVKLSWTASINSEKDLAEQILYKSKDKGKTYDNGTPVSADATSYTVYGLEPGTEYYFKITSKDKAGNESSGTVKSATLPATGPGIGLLALASFGASFMARRKKKASVRS